jgi:T1SS-143 domain-containing protein
MSTIGTVSQLVGRAIAVKADGSERVLAIGDEILADELIRVSPDGSLQIKMENGEPLFLEGGQSWLATAETYQTSEEFDSSEAIADVDSIQAAILAGADPTEVAEETAAGGEGEAEGNEGSSIVQIIANREEVDPTAGFETIGFSDSTEDTIEEEFFDDVPKILGTTTVLLDEDDLVAEGALAADFEALRSDFESAVGLTAFAANAQGQDDIAEGDDLPSGALTVLSGNLDVDFGADGDGNITFNDSSTQPTGITSAGADVQYWISEDGHSLVAYVQSEGSAEIIFTAQITDAASGQFQVALYGALDHTDSSTEDNLILDLSFTIQDSDDDTAIGILRLDIDDDAPVIGDEKIESEGSIVDEEGLATAATQDDGYDGDVAGSSLVASGDLNISWGADDNNDGSAADRSVTFSDLSDLPELTSNGVEVTYSVNSDGTVLTASAGDSTVFVVTLSDLGSGSYNFELFDNLDHPTANTEDDLNLLFAYTATDADGDSAEAAFTVTVNDDAPVIEEVSSEIAQGSSIILGAPDGSADLADWGVSPGELSGSVTMNGVTVTIEFIDNDDKAGSQLKIYNNNANHIGGGSLADNDGQGINAGEVLRISFDQLMQQAEIGVDGLGNHFLPDASQQAHATWIAYKDGVEVGSGEIDNPEGQNEGLEGLLEVFTVSIPGGFDSIELGNNSKNAGSNYEVRYIKAEGKNIIDEEGLAQGNLGDSYSDGGDAIGSALTATGDLNINWGADDNNDDASDADRAVTFTNINELPALTSNGAEVKYHLNEQGTVLTAYTGTHPSEADAVADYAAVFVVTLSDVDSGSFNFELLNNLDHAEVNTEDNIEFNFEFVAKDSDGDTAEGSFNIVIDDDAPVVGDENQVVRLDDDALDGGNAGGRGDDVDSANATGTLAHSYGADGEGSVLLLDSNAPEGFTYTLNGDKTVLTISQGDTAVLQVTLTDSTSGNYTVTQLAAIEHDDDAGNRENNIQFGVDYQVTDSDGDTANGSININVDDDTPVVSRNERIRLDDDALDGGNEGGRGDNVDSANTTGTLAHNYGADGAGTILLLATHAKPGFTYELNDDQTVLTISQGDTAVLQVSLSDTSSGDYEVTQLAAIEHADDAGNRENNIQFRVDYQVTDSDGDTVNGRVNINVDDDTPVVEDDGVETAEDTSITIDVLANDSVGADGAEITSFTQPENGTVVLNEDSTFTFTPADNLHGQETFTYTITDADGDTATATVTVNVNAVADAPTLVVSVGNETALDSDENLIINGSFEDVAGIDEFGNPVDDMDLRDGIGGFYVKREEIPGWKTTEGAPMEPHYTTHAGVGTTDGVNYMDMGATPGNTNITQELNLIEGAEYKLSFDYRDKAAMQESGQSGEDSGVMNVLWNGELVATVEGNNRDAWESLSNIVLVGIAGTNTLTFAEVGDADDNWGIALDNVELFHVPYQYDLTVSSSLTDLDGSELLSDVAISSLPEGVTLEGSILKSDTPLSDEQINSITASVKSTESSNNDEAETITNAKVEFTDPSLDATGETADLLIEGTSGGDVIIGGDGDDIIFGKAGDDSLEGGSGEDLFIWEGSDVGTVGAPAHDTVTDFNAAEDVLNLTDLLSDGSHTIEGIDNGAGDLQVNIKDSGGNVVQEIELSGISVAGDASETLQTLLDTGAIDDGI